MVFQNFMFLVKVFRSLYLLKFQLNLGTLPAIRCYSKNLCCTIPHLLTSIVVKVTDFEIFILKDFGECF